MRWRQLLAWMAVFPAAATLYFFAFWRGFEFWRRRRTLTYVMLLGSFGGVGALVAVLHRWTFAGRLHPSAGIQVLGWVIVVVASAFGTVADRQIGFRVRSFTPFFEKRGRLELETTRAYGVVRHPIYAAGIAFQLGTFLVTGYPVVAVACVVLALGAQWFTRQEEARLVALLDDPTQYERYRERVPALLPRLTRGPGSAGRPRTPSR
jgi:protein-S-isoprenylcysteine O-methyltransferase Ste14